MSLGTLFWLLKVTKFLSIAGLLNGVVWAGTNVYVLFAVVPFSRGKLTAALGDIWSETILVGLYESLFLVNAICAFLALVHQAGEWLYLARYQSKKSIYLIIVCVFLGASGSTWVYPKLNTTRIEANQEQAERQQDNTAEEAFEQELDPDSKITHYLAWRNLAQLYHWVFAAGSIAWVMRFAKNNTHSRSYRA